MGSVRFPCGHINHPTFTSGGRFMPCETCHTWTSVEAKPVEVIEYVATPTTFSPPTTLPPDKAFGD